MHILVLSSNQPNFRHSYSHNTVLAVLLEALEQRGQQVSWAVVCPGESLEAETQERLESAGVRYLGDFSNEVDKNSVLRGRLRRVANYSRMAFLPKESDDYPRFRDPQATAARLRESGADIALLF